ncbi:MAG: hypothetical protein Q9190_007096, partial [Brigantiaea leucoxantha]
MGEDIKKGAMYCCSMYGVVWLVIDELVRLGSKNESDSEDEVDNSKEIQSIKIEEALKLYQNALKLHSQGPTYYNEAEAAYKSLFQSEVFTYLESLSDHQRSELYGDFENEWIDLDDPLTTVAVAPVAGTDGTPSTLPQILYLSYKNHAQFLLDKLKCQLQSQGREPGQSSKPHETLQEISAVLSSSIKLLAEALDRDETDLEVWRLVSRIAESLGSTRIARFCLEAVLDVDEISRDAWPEPLGFQEALAFESLQALFQKLHDGTATPKVPATSKGHQKFIQSLQKYVDMLPYLPKILPDGTSNGLGQGTLQISSPRYEIAVPVRNWASCGNAILSHLQKVAQGLDNDGPGASYFVTLPVGQNLIAAAPFGGDGALDIISPNIRRSAGDQSSLSNVEKTTVEESLKEIAATNEKHSSPNGSRQHSSSPTTAESAKKSAVVKESPTTIPEQYEDAPAEQNASHVESLQELSGATVVLPTRKRSCETAGIEEGGDTGRSKSKRIKARASVGESSSQRETALKEMEQYHEGQLQVYNVADNALFDHASKIFRGFAIQDLGSLARSRALVSTEHSGGEIREDDDPVYRVFEDIRIALESWDGRKSDLLLHGGGFEDPISSTTATKNSGLLVFLEQVKPTICDGSKCTILNDEGLEIFCERLQQDWKTLDQVALEWIMSLVCPHQLGAENIFGGESSYEETLWPDALKKEVVQMLVHQDERLFSSALHELKDLVQHQAQNPVKSKHSLIKSIVMIQNIFELHLDIYGRITNPSSEVDISTRIAQKDRLGRWAALAHHAVNCRPETSSPSSSMDSLSLRFLWSSVIFTNLSNTASRELVILHFQDLKNTLQDAGDGIIELQNNAIMPEISIDAAEREISRLTTMDFFITVFDSEKNNPVELIESLEPILEMSAKLHKYGDSDTVQESVLPVLQDKQLNTVIDEDPELVKTQTSQPQTQQMLQFLGKASLSLRLLLWRRLIDAYSIIDYSPRIMSCNLRCIELITQHFCSSAFSELTQEARHVALLRWLRCTDDLLTKSLALALVDTKSLECMDELHLCDSIKALATLQRILHAFVLWEDRIRVGISALPKQMNSSTTTAQGHSMAKLREMEIKLWSLQYILIREATAQGSDSDHVPTSQDLVEYLKLAHRAFGLRSYCKLFNKVFVKLCKQEITRLDSFENSEIEMAQLILDLYGLKVCPNSWEVFDHGCPAENLERQNAVEMIDRVMVQANRLNVKDLSKSELKVTMDKMQQVIKIPKNTPAIMFNRRALNNLLRSPINPIDLYRCLQGIGDMNTAPVNNEFATIAGRGWYFMLGHAALTRFRNQKRSSPGGTEDLDLALAFFRHDIELSHEKWETWFRLGQVFDAKIEEDTRWIADKLNSSKEDIRVLERSAIHCYAMAIAIAERCADPSFETINKMSELYADFGLRIFASSREPFSMEAFSLENFRKHYNGERIGMYQGSPFREMGLFSAWKFASVLLRRALIHKPENWVNWYTLGKCLWKMFYCRESIRGAHEPIRFESALDAFKKALETLPERKDNRHADKEPTLEPHYKVVSVTHKLVQSRQLNAKDGCRSLAVTQYARKIPLIEDADDWESYILQVLKALRSADKSNWHHRMVLRSAHTIYDDSSTDPRAALGAKHELTQQIFTKTMTIQVWKPENERIGRHFVYTTRYVQFLLRLLFQLNDRPGVELLARQVRKRPGKFLHHGHLWPHICETYLKLLRGQGDVPENVPEGLFKNISHEAFVQNADRLEAWAHLPATKSPLFDILREAVELKKLNANLIKASSFEDFIGDTYAYLYQRHVPDLIAKSNEEESRGRMRVDHLMNAEAPPTGEASPDPVIKTEEAAPARQRIRGVGRREIQKRAETLITKPAAAMSAVKILKSQPELQLIPRSTVQVVIKQQDDAGKDISSVPGSLHDSADDESELSDIEEMVEENGRSPMFPNLTSGKAEENEEDREGSEQEGGGSQLDDGDPEGEETYHTPME